MSRLLTSNANVNMQTQIDIKPLHFRPHHREGRACTHFIDASDIHAFMEHVGLQHVKVNDVLELMLALFPGSAHLPLSFFPSQNEESTAKEVVKAIETAESDYQVRGGWVVG